MQNLIQSYQDNMKTPGGQKQSILVLDNLPSDATADKVKRVLDSKRLQYKEVEVFDRQNSIQFGTSGALSCQVKFEKKADLTQVANEVVNKGSIKVAGNQLKMRILKEKGNYNPETSVYVGSLHASCSEQDLIAEINQIFEYNKIYRKELQKWEANQRSKQGKQGSRQPEEPIHPYFVLSCIVFADQLTGKSK